VHTRCTHTHTDTHTGAHIHTHSHMSSHTQHAHAHTHPPIHTHTPTLVCTHPHVHIHTHNRYRVRRGGKGHATCTSGNVHGQNARAKHSSKQMLKGARVWENWQTSCVEKSRRVSGNAVAVCVLGVVWARFLTTKFWHGSLFCFCTHTNTPGHTRPHTHKHPRTHPHIYQGGRGLLALKR